MLNIITDFALALLPVPLIWTLKMNLRTRISLILTLSLGCFAGAAGIVRQLSPSQFKDKEAWIKDQYNMWNFIELAVGIIAGSLPALKPLFTTFFDAVKATGKTTGSGSRNHFPQRRSYRKQDEVEDAFSIVELKPVGPTEVGNYAAVQSDQTAWDDRAKNSEESILRDHRRPLNESGGIRITTRVMVD